MLQTIILKTSLEKLSSQWKIIRESSFRVLVIPGHTKIEESKKITKRIKNQQAEPRYKRMGEGDRWMDVWPAARSFNYSSVPLPIRMGYIEGTENDGVIPSKYGNAELMKIPNFLHLTPPHIRNHCQKLKKYCTAWPKGLKEGDRMQLIHFDYVRDAPAVKDERSRFVSVMVKLSSMHFPKDSREKFLRLTSRFCVRQNDLLIITSGKCQTKQQNFDYIKFLLSVLYKESLKIEDWEGEKEVKDMMHYEWKLNKSHENVMQLLRLMEGDGGADKKDGDVWEVVEDVKDAVSIKAKEGDAEEKYIGDADESISTKDGAMDDSAKSGNVRASVKGFGGVGDDVVQRYGRSVEGLLNQKETMALVQQYKHTVQSLYSSIARK